MKTMKRFIWPAPSLPLPRRTMPSVRLSKTWNRRPPCGDAARRCCCCCCCCWLPMAVSHRKVSIRLKERERERERYSDIVASSLSSGYYFNMPTLQIHVKCGTLVECGIQWRFKMAPHRFLILFLFISFISFISFIYLFHLLRYNKIHIYLIKNTDISSNRPRPARSMFSYFFL